MAKKKKEEQQQPQQDLFPPEMVDNLRGFGDEVNVAKEAIDAFNQNLNKMNVQLQKMTEAVVNGNKEVSRQINRKSFGERINEPKPIKINKMEITPTGEVKIERANLRSEISSFVKREPALRYEQYRPISPKPDILDIFSEAYIPSEALKTPIRQSEAPQYGGEIGRLLREDLVKNFRQLGHTLSPFSFAQYSAMFGVMQPLQLKMSETITKPVTETMMPFSMVKDFAKGFSGLSTSMESFMQELRKSPLQLYEGIYQSKIMLSSALGGDRAANQTINNALKLAREYPIRTEEILSSLTRLAVYPQVKPYLQNEQFQRKLMETVAGLGMIVPEQGVGGAMFSLVEALSGSWRSLQMRFNVSPEVVQQLSGMTKAEMSSSPERLIEGLHKFVSKSIGLGVMEKQKYTFTKQVENFGDALQMLTKDVFETTGLYRTITAGATMFQTGFSSLAGSTQFLNYIGNIFKPYEEMTNRAFAKFVGVPTGMYQQLPISDLAKIIEENFKGLSMEEIGQRFRYLIKDMANVQSNMTNNINKVVNTAFGVTLSDIGNNISSVVGKEFAGLSINVIKAFGKSVLSNPMDMLQVMGTIAVPTLALLGGAQYGVAALTRWTEKMPLKQRVLNVRESLYGTGSFRAKQQMFSELVSGQEERVLFIPKLSKAERALRRGDVNKFIENMFQLTRKNYETNTLKPIEEAFSQLKDMSYKQLTSGGIIERTGLKSGQLKKIVNDIMNTQIRGKIAEPYLGDLDLVSNFEKIGDFIKNTEKTTLERMQKTYGIKTFKGMNIKRLQNIIKRKTGLVGEIYTQSEGFRQLYQAGVSEKALEDFIESFVTDRVRQEVEMAYIKNPKALKPEIIRQRVESRFTPERRFLKLEASTREILSKIPSKYGREVEVEGKKVRLAKITPEITPSNIGLARKIAEEYALKPSNTQTQAIRKALAEFDSALKTSQKSTSKFRTQSGDVIESMREIDKEFDKILSNIPPSTSDRTQRIRSVLSRNRIGEQILKPFTSGMTYSDLMGLVTEGEGAGKYVSFLKKKGVDISKLLDNEAISMFIDDLDNQGKKISEFQVAGDIEGLNNFIKDTEIGFKELNKLFKTDIVKGLENIAPTFKEKMLFKTVGMKIGATTTRTGQLAEEQRFLPKAEKFAIKGGALLDILQGGLSGVEIAKNLGVSSKLGFGVGAALPLGLTGAAVYKGGFKSLMTGKFFGGMTALLMGMSALESITAGSKQIDEYRKSVSDQFNVVRKNLKPEQAKFVESYIMPEKYYNVMSTTRHTAGMANVKRNVGEIAGSTILGGLSALALPLLAGGPISLPMVLAGAAIAGGGSFLHSYFSGRGQLTETEKFKVQATQGFISQYSIVTNKLNDVNKQIANLEKISKTGSLTKAERVKLQQLYADRGVLKTLQVTSISGMQNIAQISSITTRRLPSGRTIYGTNIIGTTTYSDQKKMGEKNLYATESSARLARFLDETRKNMKNMSFGQKMGAVTAANTYLTDVVMSDLKKYMESGNEDEQKAAFLDLSKILRNSFRNINKLGESLKSNNVTQARTYAEAVKATLKNLIYPVSASKEVKTKFMENVTPELNKLFFKSYIGETFATDNKIKNIFAGLRTSIGGKYQMMGIGETPEKILEMSKAAFISKYKGEKNLSTDILGKFYDNIQKEFSKAFRGGEIEKSLNNVKTTFDNQAKVLRDVASKPALNNIILSRASISSEGSKISAQEGYAPLTAQSTAFISAINRDIQLARTSREKILGYQQKIKSGKTLTPVEMKDLNESKQTLDMTMKSLNTTFGATKELIGTKINSSLEKFGKTLSMASQMDLGSYRNSMKNIFTEFQNTLTSVRITAGFKRASAIEEIKQIRPFLENIGLKEATLETFTKRGVGGFTAYEKAIMSKTPQELQQLGFTPDVQRKILDIQTKAKEANTLELEANVQAVNFARMRGQNAVTPTFLGRPETVGLDLFTRNRQDLREKIRNKSADLIKTFADAFMEAKTPEEKLAAYNAVQSTFKRAAVFGVDNTYLQSKMPEYKKFQESVINYMMSDYGIQKEKAITTLGYQTKIQQTGLPLVSQQSGVQQQKVIKKEEIEQPAKELSKATIPLQQVATEIKKQPQMQQQIVAKQKEITSQGVTTGGAACLNICSGSLGSISKMTQQITSTQTPEIKQQSKGILQDINSFMTKGGGLSAMASISTGIFGAGVAIGNPVLMGLGALGNMFVGIGKLFNNLVKQPETEEGISTPKIIKADSVEVPNIEIKGGVEQTTAEQNIPQTVPNVPQPHHEQPVQAEAPVQTPDAHVAAQSITDALLDVSQKATQPAPTNDPNPNYYLGPLGIGA